MSDIYVGSLFSGSYLEHHGILGMKWGVRRYQNEDGTLTTAGKKRYKTKTNFEKQTARDRRIRRNVVKGVKTAATLAIAGYTFANQAKVYGALMGLYPRASYQIGKQAVRAALNHVSKSSKDIGSFKDMTMKDLEKLDLW